MKAFGAAPAIRQLNNLKKLGVAGSVSGATLWFYFRNYYPITFSILWLIFCIVPFFVSKSINGHLLFGSVLSMLASFMVVLSFIQVVPWRKHPSPLILYRTLSNMLFSMAIIVNVFHLGTGAFDQSSYNDDGLNYQQASSCSSMSFTTQFALFTSECWLLTISVDLVSSLTNPFSSYKANLRKYHAIVWTLGVLIALALVGNTECQGILMADVCWIKPSIACLWGYFFAWMFAFYTFSLAVMGYSYLRIRKGLESTYMTRKAIVNDTFRVIIAYIIYMSIIGLMLIIIASYVKKSNFETNLQGKNYDDDVARKLLMATSYFVACRGLVDATLWFILHDFARDPSVQKPTGFLGMTGGNLMDRLRFLPLTSPSNINNNNNKSSNGSGSGSNNEDQEDGVTIPRASRPTPSDQSVDIEDDGVDIDLTPQLNMALRQEMVHFVTVGLQEGVLRKKESQGAESHSFLLDGRYKFTDYRAMDFHELRVNNGLSEEYYLSQISQPAKEKLSEGLSGAFMFYCGSDFIVKTVKKSEAKALLEIFDIYKSHLDNHPDSILVKFYGLHSLKMYSQEFNFVVMGNIFPKSAIINERYDIKGSWVNRNAGVAAPGTKAFCRHCSEMFIVGSNMGCPEVVGPHESNIILKDNDLSTKIRMRPQDAFKLIEVINSDSDALAVMGIMDYSLLIGVRNLQYDVDPEGLLRKLDSYDGSGPIPNTIRASGKFNTLPTIIESPMHIPASLRNPPGGGGAATANVEVGAATGGYLARAVIAPGVYYFGIIDILQTWTMKKRIERAAKIYIQGKSAAGLSVMAPGPYKDRFQKKVSQLIEHSIFVREVTGSWQGKRELSAIVPLVNENPT